jgi:hypothetical protein
VIAASEAEHRYALTHLEKALEAKTASSPALRIK